MFVYIAKILVYLRNKGFFKKNEADFCCRIVIVPGLGNVFWKISFMGDLLPTKQIMVQNFWILFSAMPEPCQMNRRKKLNAYLLYKFISQRKSTDFSVFKIIVFCRVRVHNIFKGIYYKYSAWRHEDLFSVSFILIVKAYNERKFFAVWR